MDIGGVLTGLGGGGLLATAISTFVNRRKLGADTAAVLTKAASGLVQDLEKQIERLRAEVTDLETRVRALTTELDAAHDLNRHKDDLIAAFTREREHNPSSSDQ